MKDMYRPKMFWKENGAEPDTESNMCVTIYKVKTGVWESEHCTSDKPFICECGKNYFYSYVKFST